MIVDKILGKYISSNKMVETISIDWFERDKKILRKSTSSGEEIGIKIDSTLNENDIIYEDDNRIIIVDIAPCDLISIEVSTMKEMGRLCFELGNRHLSLSIEDNMVKCPFDTPTFEYLKKLGFKAKKIHDKFTGYTECKAHAHNHGHHNHE